MRNEIRTKGSPAADVEFEFELAMGSDEVEREDWREGAAEATRLVRQTSHENMEGWLRKVQLGQAIPIPFLGGVAGSGVVLSDGRDVVDRFGVENREGRDETDDGSCSTPHNPHLRPPPTLLLIAHTLQTQLAPVVAPGVLAESRAGGLPSVRMILGFDLK